jgi:subtilisin family serine protease
VLRSRAALAVALTCCVAGPGVGVGRASVPGPEAACSQGQPQRNVLVGVAPGSGPWLAATAHRLGATSGPRIAPLSTYELRFASPSAARAGAEALRVLPQVRYAEAEQTYSVSETPADPLYPQQWALQKVSAPAAWNVEVGSTRPVTVAVLDTGADFGHPDLAGRLLAGLDVLSPGATPQDDHTHGTHVAGIIAAGTNNRIGVAGLSWGAQVLPVKALDAHGAGSTCNVVAAVAYTATQSVQVVNMSLGAPGPCPAAMQDAVDVATHAGALVVAAAGNSGADFNTTESPANCDGTFGVAATDAADHAASFSNFGSYVDVAAPGVDILSTVIDPKTHKHGYANLSGTSMACPMVAGLAALLVAEHADWTPQQVVDRITHTSVDLGTHGWDPHFGAGRIDAARALS